MSRDLPVGNGNLLVNFDANYNIRDIYYPYVGKENHSEGCISRTGVWVDGRFAWIDDPGWRKNMVYETETLVTKVTATNDTIGLTLTFHDVVDFHRDIFLRKVDIINHEDRPRDVRLFFHYDFRISGNDVGDSIYYHPKLKGLVAYKENRYFLASGKADGKIGISQWTTGSKEPTGGGTTWRDAEDGRLNRTPIANGAIEGIIGLDLQAVPAKGKATIYHWLAVSKRFHGVEELNDLVNERGPESFIVRTRDYWRAWVNKESVDFANLPTPIANLYKRSLLVMRTQIDNRGAITAANDSDITQFWRDTPSYVWGRDGALTAKALDMAGFGEIARNFFRFCAKTITSEGYFLHRYTPDGALASGWMPWTDEDGNLQLPIQEDSTALVLYSLWAHYVKFRDVEFIRSLYRKLIKNAADFMVRYRDPDTGFPSPSWDLWEERWGIHSFTIAAVWAGLQAAANFTETFGEVILAKKYRQAAAEIKDATIKHLFDKAQGRFLRSIEIKADGSMQRDYVIDSSIGGLFLFGMFEATDPLIESTMKVIKDRLWCKTKVGGMARYEDDHHLQISQDIANVPGNPWLICAMWLAQYFIAKSQALADLKPALDILQWAHRCALPSGVLPEQVNPNTGAPLSVSPLTWSHAQLVVAVREYLNKYWRLQRR